MTSKKRIVTATIIGVVCYIFLQLLIISIIVFFPFIMDFFTRDKITVPEPQITNAEFPFHIEFMINEERIVVDNTLICEYEGFEKYSWMFKVNTGTWFIRDWKQYIKHYDTNVTEHGHLILYSNNEIEFMYVWGSAEYYMGDNNFKSNVNLPGFKVNGYFLYNLENLEELQKYGIEIIDFVPPEPIENTFE